MAGYPGLDRMESRHCAAAPRSRSSPKTTVRLVEQLLDPVGLHAARRLERDVFAHRRIPQRPPHWRLRRELSLLGVGLRRTHQRPDVRLAALNVLDVRGPAECEDARARIRLHHHRLAEPFAESLDSCLEMRLVVLGEVVLGVLLQVAELTRGLDPLRHLTTPRLLELLQLRS